MKRFFDFLFSLILVVVLIIPALAIALLIKMTSEGPILFWSKRVGVNKKIFMMPKFRTMKQNTPDMATHLLKHPDKYLTPMGPLLRQSSLDELPQIFSVLMGHMSFVGPRPALFNQEDLISLRVKKGLHKLKPGITGWAQVNGRDEISIPEKVKGIKPAKMARGVIAKLTTKSTLELKARINSHICSKCKNHIKIDNKESNNIFSLSLFTKSHTSDHPF